MRAVKSALLELPARCLASEMIRGILPRIKSFVIQAKNKQCAQAQKVPLKALRAVSSLSSRGLADAAGHSSDVRPCSGVSGART